MIYKKEIFIWIILISMSTALSFAVDERQMNLLLVGIMAIIPFFLVVRYPHLKKSEILVYLLLATILFSSLFHFDSFRITTVLYTTMFLFTFVYYFRLVNSIPLKINTYIKIIIVLLTLYFVVLIIQQLSVLLDLPFTLNLILGDPKKFKLNSLAPEPSHAARILTVLMYSYVCMIELKMKRSYNLMVDGRKDIYLWFIFLYTTVTMGSGFAIVFLMLLLLKFLQLRRVFYSLPIILIVFITVSNLDLHAVERVKEFGLAFFSFNEKSMMETDHSASIRIVPTLLYLQMFDISNINTWLGFGTDYAANLIPTLMHGIPEGEFTGGIFPTFFFNRGLIGVTILFAMIKKFCLVKLFSFDSIILLLLIFATGINTQLFWFSIILFTTNKFLTKKYKENNSEL